MKQWIASPLLLFAALLLQCTSLSDVAGRGGSETTNGITVCVYNDDGSSASGKIVRLRPSDYISAPPGAYSDKKFIIDTLTDTMGRLTLFQLPSGSYCIEIKDTLNTSSKNGALLLSFKIGDRDTINFGSDTLHPFTTIKGKVDTSGSGVGERYAQVRGLECLERVSPDGSFELHALPPGDLTMRIITVGERSFTREISHIITTPGDTSRMELSGAWTNAKRIYFNTTNTGADIKTNQYNFPALLRFDSTSFSFSTAFSHGEDIRFSKENGTAVSFEIEEWSQSKNKGTLWVLVDTIYANSSNQFLLMTWGEQGASSISNGAKVFDTATGFTGVWHLGETDSLVPDATGNHYDGTGYSTPSVPGMIGNARHFNGNSSIIRMTGTASSRLDFPMNGHYTLSAWVYHDTLADSIPYLVAGKGEHQYFIKNFDLESSIGQKVRQWEFTEYHDNDWQSATFVPATAKSWVYLTGVRDGSNEYLYVNGILAMSKTFAANQGQLTRDTSDDFTIGGFLRQVTTYNQGYAYFSGVIDEVTVSSTPRSADWVKLSFMNQKEKDALVRWSSVSDK